MTAGIYHYVDVETDEVVYIGKDSSINRSKRHLHHKKKSNYNKQPFNRVLQNNPDRYRYEVVCAGDYSPELLSILEINEIAEFKMLHNGELPKFNFTEGGEGSTGYKHSEETKQKIGESISKSQNTTGYLNVCKHQKILSQTKTPKIAFSANSATYLNKIIF